MASIRKRGPFQWQVVIRKTGYPTQTKTFESRAEAREWATECEASNIDRLLRER